MDIWSILQQGMGDITDNGNRFLIGNGYMGVRGTLEEFKKEHMPAVNLAGVYDRYQDLWREPVNAPNGLFAVLYDESGKPLTLPDTPFLSHSQSLDFRRGLHSRVTDLGKAVLSAERFACMDKPHLLCQRITVEARENGVFYLMCGIDGDVWDINGPHLFEHRLTQGDICDVTAVTGECGTVVSVAETCDFDGVSEYFEEERGVFRRLAVKLGAGGSFTVCRFIAVCTSQDAPDARETAREAALHARFAGYDTLFNQHQAAWEALWEASAVTLVGDNEAARALNYSLYHLHCIAPRGREGLSIPARGLSGQTYKGAVFWDTEIFLLPFFAYTEPELAKKLLMYRVKTLDGARKKAAEYGFRGAFYAWESQEGGFDACSDFNVTDVFTGRPVRTYFRDRQIHISGDIVYAFAQYMDVTGDTDILLEGAAEVIFECARFYASRALRRLDSNTVEFTDVIGPDEYHERVDNNAFTNAMAEFTFKQALKTAAWLEENHPGCYNKLMEMPGIKRDWPLIRRSAGKVRRPVLRDGVIEQFDGYFKLEDATPAQVASRLRHPREYWGTGAGVAYSTQVIKQADVIAMLRLFGTENYDLKLNWEYYEPRTEHGSSLSACMYALTACGFGRADAAWPLFMASASIDIKGGGKSWAGDIYIGGTHPAASGGAWCIAVFGFAGLSVKDGELSLSPCLPESVRELRFPVMFRGRRKNIRVTREGYEIM